MDYPGIITSHNWNGNNLNFSSLNEFLREGQNQVDGPGLKYVLRGEEKYFINDQLSRVRDGACLVVNEGQLFDTLLEYQKEPVVGICLTLDAGMLNDIFQNYIQAEDQLLENPERIATRFDLFESVYGKDDVLCRHLHYISKKLDVTTGKFDLSDEELFFGIAQNLLLSQERTRKNALQIKAIRYSTKKELYSRVSKAKEILDEHFAEQIEMSVLAASVALSEFHFYRTFKQAYGISPNQYQIQRRLEDSKAKLEKGQGSVSEIALASGFSDVQSFSKSFRKMFLVSPGNFKK
jgi:AraC family transcriptional regulator